MVDVYVTGGVDITYEYNGFYGVKITWFKWADIALEYWASIKFIQNQLGHAKADTTLGIYMKNNKDMIKKALKQMNGVFLND